MDKILAPSQTLSGTMQVAGDKSISHRALLIASIAEGESHIENLNDGADVQSTAKCLAALGVKIEKSGTRAIVYGCGLRGYKKPENVLDVGNSGTTIRMLTGILSGQNFMSTITGDASIQKRPMSRIVQPLRKMGARIDARHDDFAPLTINGGDLTAIDYKLPIASAQLKSCLLFAGLFAAGTTKIHEPGRSRDHTEILLRRYGASIGKEGSEISITGPGNLQAQVVYVPGDLSSAAYFIAAALLAKDAELMIENVGINPSRNTFLRILEEMGAELEVMNMREVDNELIADIFVRNSNLKGIKIPASSLPQIIDEIPILAILATQADGVTEISGASELRVKESDRISAISNNLKNMGAQVTEKEDGLIIQGPAQLHGATIDTYHDHRIAMAFSIAGLTADEETTIKDADCVAVSFPDFFEQLSRITAAKS